MPDLNNSPSLFNIPTRSTTPLGSSSWSITSMPGIQNLTRGGLGAVAGMPTPASAFAKYQNIAPGTVTPQPYEIIQDVLNNPVYSPEQKELILEGYRQNVGLDATTFDVIRNAAMGTPYTTAELEDIFKDTTGDDTAIVDTTESINDTTEEEPTLADIIAGWLERQVGPVTQEKIKGVLDRYGKTVEDFNEAVKDVPGIPSFEDFVTEGEPVVTGDGTGEGDAGDAGDNGTGDVGEDGTDKDTPTPTNGGTPTTTTTGGGDGGLNGPVETPQIISQLPQLPETETATGGLLFGAVSPTRTTDEVLAPDLFKLDVNIPLVQRLTQYSPMAAPQYMLSGISQRYKV